MTAGTMHYKGLHGKRFDEVCAASELRLAIAEVMW
jgi:hypothetical protein